MADLSQNASNVRASSAATTLNQYLLGATGTQGQMVYRDDSTQRWQLLDSDAGAGAGAAVANIRGMLLTSGANGQPASVVIKDPALQIGATLTNGVSYYASRNAGAVTADVPASGNYAIHLGLAINTGYLNFNPIASGVAV